MYKAYSFIFFILIVNWNLNFLLFNKLKRDKNVFSVHADCDPGYFGKNCRGKCTYPYYGDECQSQCDCDKDSCDVSVGCTNATQGIVWHVQYVLNKLFFQLNWNSHYLKWNIKQ